MLSREVVLRLRGDSVFWTMTRAVRKACRSLLHHKTDNVPHEYLFLGWGVWTIVGTLILIRLLTTAFRWDFPILVNHFLQEENIFVLTLLFVIVSVIGAVVIAAILTFFWWLIREVMREIQHRFWPQYDHLLVILGVIAVIFFLSQFFWLSAPFTGDTYSVIRIICGVILAAVSFVAWLKEKAGFEPFVNCILVVSGFALAISGFEDILILPEPYIPVSLFAKWLYLLTILAFLIHFVILHLYKFIPVQDGIHSRSSLFFIAIVGIGIAVLLGMVTLFQETNLGSAGQILAIIFLISVSCIAGWKGSQRNHSDLYIAYALLYMLGGLLWHQEIGPPGTHDFLTATGLTIALGGFCLRFSAVSKTALGTKERGYSQLAKDQWDFQSAKNF